MATWMKVETRVRTHPKIGETVKTTGHTDAAWLWLAGNLYCRDALTDGFISDVMLSTLIPGLPLRVLKTLPPVLVKHGLWHQVDGGYQVHDFGDYNPTKAEVEEKLRADRDRKKGRPDSERNPHGLHEDSALSRAGRAPAGAFSPSPSASGGGGSTSMDGKNDPEGGAGETAPTVAPRPPKVPPGRSGLLESPGRWGVEHNDHVEGFCTFVCFPGRLFREFVTRVRGAGGDAELAETQVREWALAYRASFQGIPGDDMWSFWKHAWATTHGSNKPAPRPRGHAGGIDALIAQGRTQS